MSRPVAEPTKYYTDDILSWRMLRAPEPIDGAYALLHNFGRKCHMARHDAGQISMCESHRPGADKPYTDYEA